MPRVTHAPQSVLAQETGCSPGETQYWGESGTTFESISGNDVWTYWVSLTWCVDGNGIITSAEASQYLTHDDFIDVWSLSSTPNFSLVTINREYNYAYVNMTGEVNVCINVFLYKFCRYEYPNREVFGYADGSYWAP
jgi:hypothetical protein